MCHTNSALRSLLLIMLFLANSRMVCADDFPNHYEVLDVPFDATPEVIKKSYKDKIPGLHPDRHPGDSENSERFKAVKEAHAVLSDPKKRKKYDWKWERIFGALQGNGSSPEGLQTRTPVRPASDHPQGKQTTGTGKPKQPRFNDFENSMATHFTNLRFGPNGLGVQENVKVHVPPSSPNNRPPLSDTEYNRLFGSEPYRVNVLIPTPLAANSNNTSSRLARVTGRIYEGDPNIPIQIRDNADQLFIEYSLDPNGQWYRERTQVSRSLLAAAMAIARRGEGLRKMSDGSWEKVRIHGLDIDLSNPNSPIVYYRHQPYSFGSDKDFLMRADEVRDIGNSSAITSFPSTVISPSHKPGKTPDEATQPRQRLKIMPREQNELPTLGRHSNGTQVDLGILDDAGRVMPISDAQFRYHPSPRFLQSNLSGFLRRGDYVYMISRGSYYVLGDVHRGLDGEYLHLYPGLRADSSAQFSNLGKSKGPKELVGWDPRSKSATILITGENKSTQLTLTPNIGAPTGELVPTEPSANGLSTSFASLPKRIETLNLATRFAVFHPTQESYATNGGLHANERELATHVFNTSNLVEAQEEFVGSQVAGIGFGQALLHQLALYGAWHHNMYGEPVDSFHNVFEVLSLINQSGHSDPKIPGLLTDYMEALEVTNQHSSRPILEQIALLLLKHQRNPAHHPVIQSYLLYELQSENHITGDASIFSRPILELLELYLADTQSDEVIRELRKHQHYLKTHLKGNSTGAVKAKARELIELAERVITKIGGFETVIHLPHRPSASEKPGECAPLASIGKMGGTPPLRRD